MTDQAGPDERQPDTEAGDVAPRPQSPDARDVRDGANGKAPKARSKGRSKRSGKRPVQRGSARADRGATRHQARVLAMQALFEHGMTDHGLEVILSRLADEEGETVPPPVEEHAARLARGVDDHLAEIDPYIAEAAPMYPLPQLASIDRGVLRLAVYELLFERNVPFRVVINEAVEIAKRFGGPSSGRFVNGVLGTIVDRIPPAEAAPTATVESAPPEAESTG